MHIHFIGIGGIGVSALAKYYLARGDTVSGSDLMPSEITRELSLAGAAITIGTHRAAHLPRGVARVIYTAAVSARNPEYHEAKKRKIKTQSYAQAIGALTKQYKTIAVAGAHGKSTTTALTALVLEEGYLDPTVIVGTKLKEFGNSNFRPGKGQYLVLEADEFNRSFLNYHPFVAVITNIDREHLDTYRGIAEIQAAFRAFAAKIPRGGTIVANRDNEWVRDTLKKSKKKISWYSLEDKEASTLRTILKIPGEHNVSNALAALHAGRALGISEPDILRGLGRFTGAWRRFEFKDMWKGAYIFSDYAHHPTEIKATIDAARKRFPLRRIWCVYQPHQYQRLALLWDEFHRAFDMADRICILPVYEVAGRERTNIPKHINSQQLAHDLVQCGKNAHHVDSLNEAKTFILHHIKPGDVVIFMGAGDIYTLTP